MTTWQPSNLGQNISTIVQQDDAQDEAIRSFERGSTAPTLATRPAGLLHSTLVSAILTSTGAAALSIPEAMVRWDGTNWVLQWDVRYPMINDHGTIPFAADQPMGGFKLTGLAAGSASGHSVRYEQVVLRSGALAWTGTMDAGGQRLSNLGAPSAGADALRLQDVDAENYGHFYNTNENAIAHPDGGVKYYNPSAVSTSFTHCGFRPRVVEVRVYGKLTQFTDNSAVGGGAVFDRELRFVCWDPQPDSGYTNTAPVFTAGPFTLGSDTIYVDVELRDEDDGFWLRVRRTAGGGEYLRVRNAGDTSVDGAMQVLCFKAY
jgi:hypothetical protein